MSVWDRTCSLMSLDWSTGTHPRHKQGRTPAATTLGRSSPPQMQKRPPHPEDNHNSATWVEQVNKRLSLIPSSARPVALRVYTHPGQWSNCDWRVRRTTGRRNCMFGRMLNPRATARLRPVHSSFATHKLRYWRGFPPRLRIRAKIARQLGYESSCGPGERKAYNDLAFSSGCIRQLVVPRYSVGRPLPNDSKWTTEITEARRKTRSSELSRAGSSGLKSIVSR